MNRYHLLLLAVLLSVTTSLHARPKKKAPPPPPAAKVEPAKADPPPKPTTTTTTTTTTARAAEGEDAGRRGPSRIEFDDRLVQGQTNKANAIYLFERRESSLRSLLKKRTNFHDEIDEMLEDELVR